jgi:hypothetical protein
MALEQLAALVADGFGQLLVHAQPAAVEPNLSDPDSGLFEESLEGGAMMNASEPRQSRSSRHRVGTATSD